MFFRWFWFSVCVFFLCRRTNSRFIICICTCNSMWDRERESLFTLWALVGFATEKERERASRHWAYHCGLQCSFCFLILVILRFQNSLVVMINVQGTNFNRAVAVCMSRDSNARKFMHTSEPMPMAAAATDRQQRRWLRPRKMCVIEPESNANTCFIFKLRTKEYVGERWTGRAQYRAVCVLFLLFFIVALRNAPRRTIISVWTAFFFSLLLLLVLGFLALSVRAFHCLSQYGDSNQPVSARTFFSYFLSLLLTHCSLVRFRSLSRRGHVFVYYARNDHAIYWVL